MSALTCTISDTVFTSSGNKHEVHRVNVWNAVSVIKYRQCIVNSLDVSDHEHEYSLLTKIYLAPGSTQES